MRLWLQFIGVGAALWLVGLPGTDPLLRIIVVAGALVWGANTAARPHPTR
jgi:hypothetical protein